MWLYDAATGVSYELLYEIHVGGEGRTWRARQVGLSGRELPVAVKILSRAEYFNHNLDTRGVYELWKRQEEIIRYFNDRGFVPVQGVFWTAAAPGRPCPPEGFCELPAVVTAWVDGEGLREWSEHVEDPLSRLAVLQVCAAALDRFHSKMGHVHRDLNPNNILVASDGIAEIIDYGLLRDASVARSGTKPIGTPSYIAPEILDGACYSADTDRYSFAAIIFHQLLRTDPPPIGTSRRQVVAAGQLTDGGYRPVASLIVGWLNDVPGSRPAAAGALDMLNRVMHQIRITAPAAPASWPEQGWPTERVTRPASGAKPPFGSWTEPSPGTAARNGTADPRHDAGVELGRNGTAAIEVPVRLLPTLLLASVVFMVILAGFALTYLIG